jgi:murein DD-endopeptidase MepM/ murein hydrolase activator NlpD
MEKRKSLSQGKKVNLRFRFLRNFTGLVLILGINSALSQAALASTQVPFQILPKKIHDGEFARVIGSSQPFEVQWKEQVVRSFLHPTTKAQEAWLPIPHDTPAGKIALEVILRSEEGRDTQATVSFDLLSGRYRDESLRVDPRHVNPPANVRKRIEEEQAITKKIYDQSTPELFWSGSFSMPMKSRLTSPFGTRRRYNGETRNFHAGVDFLAAKGSPVFASGAGRVVLAQDLYFSGNAVIIDHGQGLYTQYIHLSRFKVKVGDLVQVGQQIAWSGNTGRTTGPHLHFGSVLHGVRVHPLRVIEATRAP